MGRVAVDSGYHSSGNDEYGSGSNSNYVPQLFSKKVLKNFQANTYYKEITNNDYDGEIKSFGDKVTIRRAPHLTVGDYSIGGTIDYEVPLSESTDLEIDKAKYVAFRVDDVDKVQSDIGLVNMFAEDASTKISISVDQDLLDYMAMNADAQNMGEAAGIGGAVDLGKEGAGIVITTENAVDYIVTMNQILDEQNISSVNRFVVIPAWYAAMLKLGDLKRVDVTGDGSGEAIINYAC
jgi:hypothetical protein